MKKTHIGIFNLFLIDNKIFLSQELTCLVNKLSGNFIKGDEYVSIKAIKKTVFSKLILVLLTGLIGLTSYSQTYKAFSIRKKIDIRGKMIVAGNNILGKDNLPFNDNTKANQDVSMQYIDIDGDPSTFSSSSADLSVPPQKDGSATTCYRVAYAALYWGAMLQNGSRTDINKVKLKLPGATTYNDVNGEIVYDAVASPIIPDANKPYACYADVTSLLAGLTNLSGTYTVANVTSSIGANGSTGLSAGWTLFVVYEDPSLNTKSFSVFDGFSHVYASHFEKIPVSGFITPPSGNIDLQFAYAAMDGDKPQGGTKLEFGTKEVTTPLRPANRFFNSTIENTNGVSTPRNPSGSNTLGYDTGVLEVKSAQPEYIVNNQTSTDFTLQVAKGQADPVFVFFSAYAVDIIAPKIDLTKIVKNTSGVNVGGGNVTLGQSLTYEISYQSVGNDNVKNFTIKDVLPINITFNPATNIDYTNAGGATLQSYDPVTRTIIFNIPSTSVEVNDGIYTIRLNIQVVPDCNSLTTACSNVIKNQAFATYQGVINTNVFQEEGSFASTACKLGSPESTNFLVDISNCKFTQNVILCGSSVVLKASDGYSTYSWSRNPDGSSPIGTGQTFTATQIGTYYVHNTAPATCKDIVEEITVKYFGVTNTNPVIPYAQLPYLGEVVTCPDDGKKLPNLFLCGANDTRVINTGISDATSIEWYKLNEGSCTAVVNPDCANENPSCSWTLVGTGPDYTANISGQFRLTIKYAGGCFSQFYFNVYQNLLNPTVTSKDILCTTNGQITVGGVPTGYEYSLNSAGPYQPSNVFPNASFPVINAGSYTVYIKQVGVTANPCIFSVPNILIRKRDFTVSTILTQPLCKGDKGAVKLIANDALPQYYFSISQGATLVNSVGPIAANEYQFSNLNPGVYTVRVRTDDGCDYSNSVEIIEPVLLTATAAITKPLTCADGEITVYPVGGTPPFIYYVNSTTVFQSTPQIAVTNPLPAGGIYNIVVEDSNNCTISTSITVAAIPPPVYTMSQTDIKCYNDNTGVINFNVTNANGYTLAYNIDNGVTYLPTPTFSNLVAGTYNTIVRYTLGTAVCYGTMQAITITQPTTALTASAGVSELAGCGPSGEGKIRITNPQGGTAPYEYSFDNQATWTTVNDAYKAPGTYTVYIRDANGCIFAMPNIVINQPPIAPTISVSSPVFNCDGSTKSTVTVTTTPNVDYSYQYLLDGVVNTNVPSNVFVNIPAGNHVISVKYISTSTAVSCIPQSDFPFIVPTGNAFNASITGFQNVSCFGANDGTVTIAAQNFDATNGFQFSTNNGATWNTQLTSPYTIIGLAAANYTILIRYDATASGTCVKTFSQTITAPSPLTVTASVTTLATCSTGATVTAIGAGGTLAYQYELRDAAGVVVIRPYQLNAQFTNVPVGNYTVFAKDANGCVSAVGASLNVVAPPTLTAALDAGSDICFDSVNQASLIVNASGGTPPFTYSLNGAAAQNSNTFNNVGTGTHKIVVTDSNNCTATISNIVIAPQLQLTATLSQDLTCLVNASINTTVTGGYGTPYTYTVSYNSGAPTAVASFPYTAIADGTYVFTVTDSKGCKATSNTITVSPKTTPTLTYTKTDITCNNANDGTITVTASNGFTTTYTYAIKPSSSATYTTQATNQFTGLSAGTYNIKVIDSKGCESAVSNVIIVNPAVVTGAISATDIQCSSAGTVPAVVTVTAGGGIAPYKYSFNSTTNFTNANTYSTSVAGPVTAYIQDANGCQIGPLSVVIGVLEPITDITITDNGWYCSTTPAGGQLTIAAVKTGVLNPMSYQIISGPAGYDSTANPTGIFQSLAPGAYIFQATDTKTNCSFTKPYTISGTPAIVAGGSVIAPIKCFGDQGTIQFTVSGVNINGYDYVIKNTGGTTVDSNTNQTAAAINLNNLPASNYTITVTDRKTQCTATYTVTLSQPATALTISSTTATNVNCNNDNSQITISTNGGGTPNYTYAFAPSPSTIPSSTYGSGSVLTVDTNSGVDLIWDVYVKDANNCTTKSTVTIISDPMPAITNVAVNNQCTASGSIFTITATGTGLAPLTYGISGPTGAFQSSSTFTVAPGTYTVFIKDGNGCIVSATTPITVYPQLAAVAAVTKTLDCSVASPDAVITTTISGGKAPYTYTVQKGSGTPSLPSASSAALTFTYSVSNANADTYTFVITDANNCTSTTTATVNPITNPTVSETHIDPLCNGFANGSVQLVGAGGSGGYKYSDDNVTFVTSGLFTNLAAGTHIFYVKDSKGCPGTITATLNNPISVGASAVVTTPFSCSTSNTKVGAVITVTGSGGTGTFTYSFNNGTSFSSSNTLTVNDNGSIQSFDIIIKDGNGCLSSVQHIDLAPLNPPTITGITHTDIYCFPVAKQTSQVTVTAANGVGTLTYEITAPIASAASNTTGVFNGLAGGITYLFKVTDANGCFAISSHNVPVVIPIAVTATKLTDVDCFGGSTGSARFNVTGFSNTGNYTIAVTSIPAALPYSPPIIVGDVITLNGLVKGTYNFSVTDNTTGCTDNKSVAIIEPTNPLDISLVSNVNANCNVATARVTVAATGGTSSYTYAFVPIGNIPGAVDYIASNVANLNPATPSWDVWVKDTKGCTDMVNVSIATDPIPTVTASVTNQCSASGSTFQILAVGAGGVAPYTYSINTGVAPSPAATFTVAAGTYTITVTDANGCPNTTSITVNQALTASAIVTKDITCSIPQEATIKVDVLGGKAPFGYRVKIGAGSFSGLPIAFAGTSFIYPVVSTTGNTYQFEITDANGMPCTTLTNVVTTNTPIPVTATETHVDPTCNGFTDGSIKLTATTGVPPFTYSITGVAGPFVSSNVFGGLAGGSYDYVVRDAKGCDAIGSINLVNPLAIVVNIVRNAIQCNTNTLGSFDVNVTSGGTAPYVYRLYDNAFTQLATYTETSAAATPVYSFTGLNFGDYYITVVDANGCEFKSAKLRIETPPYLAITATIDSNNCATGVDVTVTTSGGTGPFKYSIFGQPSTETAPLASNSYTFLGLSHGITYFLQVKDFFNCISIYELPPVFPPSTIKITGTTSTNVTCNATSTGTLAFTVQDYDSTVTNINYEVVNALTLLPLSTPINGTLIGALGGPVSGNITTLPAGNYVLKVSEATGTLCSAAYTFTITQPVQPLTSNITSVVNANCNLGALVTLKTTGGTGPYTYAYALAPIAPTVFASGNVLNLDYSLGINWNITVKDANGCTVDLGQVISKDPSPVIALSVVDKCVAEGTFGINVNETIAGVGSYSISVDGGVFNPIAGLPYIVTGLNSGGHTIIIKDANGCTDSKSITIAAPLQLTPAIDTLPTCADNDGQITLTGTGGTGTYTFSISPVAGTVTGNVISGLPANIYTVTMTDNATPTVCSTSVSVTLIAPTPVTFTTVVNDAKCNGDSNGVITVNLSAGNNNPSYTYEITAGPTTRPAQPSNVFTGLPAGTYTVRVNSGRGCSTDDANVVVDQPLGLTATPTVAAYACNASNIAQPALVTVNVDSVLGVPTGTGPYKYNFDGSTAYYDANTLLVTDNGSPQTIHFYVMDANGCTYDNTVIVPPYQKITGLTFAGAAITCNNPTTDITVGVTGGYPIAKYEIVSPTLVDNGINPILAALSPGTYLFKVTDANGCSFEDSHTIAPVTNITVAGQLISDVTCNENPAVTNGAVTFTVENVKVAGAFTYVLLQGSGGTIVPSANAVTLTNLGIGTYEIEVTDSTTGCKATSSVVVSQPATPLTLTEVSNVNANCNIGAQVTVAANGGTPNYTYAFVADNATPLITDYTASASAVLPITAPAPNNYDVWVKDNNGCAYKLDIVINEDALPIIAMPASQCYVGTPFTINLSLGQTVSKLPATYTINGSNQTSPIYTVNAPGTYQLSIVDANGCSSNTVNYIVQPQLTLTAAMTQDLTCAVNASITLTAGGGIAPYVSYEVNNGSGYIASANPFTTATAGTYKFRVTDTQGCQAESQDVIVTPNTTPTANPAPTNVSCIGTADGTITLTPSGGIIPYQYSINGGAYQASNVFSGLAFGNYSIVVKDAKECTLIVIPVSITEPTAVTATHTVTPFGCNTTNAPQDAIVTIIPGGGTPGYSYSFDNGANWQASASFSVNSAQTIQYVVRDANGCSFSDSAVVAPYTPPTDMDITATPIYCSATPAEATVTVNSVTDGVGPYTFEIIAPATAVTTPSVPSNTISFANLAPDTYTIKVTDANGCSTTKAILVEEADKISVNAQLVNDVYCNGDSSGAVEFTVANYITAGNYTYGLVPPPAVLPTVNGDVIRYTNLPVGNYTFTVTDGVSGCVATVANFPVNEPALALSSSSVATNINCNNDTVTVTITANGGTAPYKYVIAKASDPVPATGFVASNQLVVDTNNGIDMNWVVYVKDANNCDANNPQVILLDVNPTITTAIATQCPSPTGTYDITVTATGFSTALQYSVDGVSFQTSNIITVNAPGNYNVTVKDANGCLSAAYPVTILEPLTLKAVITKIPTCNNADGEVTLTATGGTIPSTYQYSRDGVTYVPSNVFTGLAPNILPYTFYVKDTGTGCVKSIDFTIEPATIITGFALSKTDVTCNGGNDGTITATMTSPSVGVNDNPVYMYSLNGGTPQASNMFTGLIVGTYSVGVTSGRGCIANQTTTVNEPAIIVVPAPAVVQFGCNSGSNAMNFATITVTGVTGGSGVYNYEFIKGGIRVQFGTSNTYTEGNLLGGTYTVNVYDNKGCMGTAPATITINPFIALDKINVTINNAITCTNLEDITVSASSIGGTPTNLKYTVVDSNATTGVIGVNYNFTNTTGIFTGLNIGNYLITVENLDTGCSIQSVHYVNNPNTFDLTINNIVDVTCFGGTNGSANVTIIDRIITATNPDQAGPFSYTIVDALGNPVSSGTSPNAGPFTINALASGTYSITATLTNSPYCGVTKNFTINQPNTALTIAETHTAITCISGNNDGSISASAVGGWPGGYQFELTGPVNIAYSSQTNFTGLTAGAYTINVKDSKGCVATTSVTLANPTPIVFTASPSTPSVSCFGDKNASITVSLPTGGQGSNYLYTLNTTSIVPPTTSGPQASPLFSGLGAGTYTVTVTDGYSCSATSAPVVIGEPSIVTASLVVGTTQTCNNPATLTLSAVGGTPPYIYSADGVTYNAATFNPSVTFPVAVGTHHYYVKDANGCTSYVSNDIQIDPLPALSIKLDLSNAVVNCAGDATGVIVATAQGGLGNYVYTLQDASGNPIPAAVQASPGVFTQLVAGGYKVQVSSLDCSATSALITVTEPSTPLTATYVATDATCNGANNGTIVINASGGTGIIKYAISPRLDQFFVSNKFELLQPGFYEIIAQDQNGCYIHTLGIEIKEPTLIIPSVDPLTIIPEQCFGDKDGAFTVDIIGGTMPYSVSLDKINGPFTPGTAIQTQFDFTGLAGGDHVVYIRDANLCNAEMTVPLPASVKLNPNAIVDYGCDNNSPSLTVTVTIDASITNPADVDYALDSSGSYQASNVFTNVAPGIHHITARHTNGCEKDTPDFEILQVDPLTLVLNDGGLNEIVATTTGGSPGYRYTLNGEDFGSQNSFIFYKSGDYTVTVTDSNGCVATATRHFDFIDIKIPNVFTPNGDGDNDGWTPTNTINYPDLIFHIFDRYGRKVGTYREGQSWDGKYNGKELPTGDYWYVLKLQNENDSREFVGHFTLYR